MPCHNAQIISKWFLEHVNEFSVHKWPPDSPDLKPVEQIVNVVKSENQHGFAAHYHYNKHQNL